MSSTTTPRPAARPTQIPGLRGNTNQDDTVSVTFTYTGTAAHQFTLVSYTAPAASFDANTASQQQIYQVSTIIAQPGQTVHPERPEPELLLPGRLRLRRGDRPLRPGRQQHLLLGPEPPDRRRQRRHPGRAARHASSGFVYVDANNDGVKQSGEAGIAGVTVTITGHRLPGAHRQPVGRHRVERGLHLHEPPAGPLHRHRDRSPPPTSTARTPPARSTAWPRARPGTT